MSKVEAVCRVLCRQNGDDPGELVSYGNGFRWHDYHVEAREILSAVARVGNHG